MYLGRWFVGDIFKRLGDTKNWQCHCEFQDLLWKSLFLWKHNGSWNGRKKTKSRRNVILRPIFKTKNLWNWKTKNENDFFFYFSSIKISKSKLNWNFRYEFSFFFWFWINTEKLDWDRLRFELAFRNKYGEFLKVQRVKKISEIQWNVVFSRI